MSNLFNSVQLRRPKKNPFNLSHEVKTTGNQGDLIPILCQEVVPGDKFRCRSEIFCRFMPMLAPVMQRMDIYTHYFYVPNRILWNKHKQTDSWEAFYSRSYKTKAGYEDIEIEPPHFNVADLVNLQKGGSIAWNSLNLMGTGSLWDYFGLPTISKAEINAISTPSNEKILALPFIAYQLIYDEYYRDENYQDPIIEDSSSIGQDELEDNLREFLTVRKRAWKKDYFTSALPWSQRLTKPVEFPLVGNAVVTGSANLNGGSVVVNEVGAFPNEGGLSYVGFDKDIVESGGYPLFSLQDDQQILLRGVTNGSAAVTGVADMTNVSALNVQMLREGLRLQEYFERSAVGGARYVESIYAHFGEMVPDKTTQRPIYLGGGKQTIRVSEVLQSVDTETGALGDMAGHGVSVGRTHGFNNRMFTEHGWIIGIMSVIPKASYMQTLNKKWSRFDILDYYSPEFAHLGEQEVKIKELQFGFDANDDDVSDGAMNGSMNNDLFGYQSRYAEYKHNQDVTCGEFKTTLDYWHLGRKFTNQFANNIDFLEVQPEDTERIFAVQDNGSTHKLLFQIYHDMQAIRPMPIFATPTI